MIEFVSQYFTVDRIGSALALLIIASVFAAVRHYERVRPAKEPADG